MSIQTKFVCNGCFNEEQGGILKREFISANGKGYGFGQYNYQTALDVAPEGWLPYCIVGATYCPECVKELEAEQNDQTN